MTRKEEIVRFERAKSDEDFAKMLKVRGLGPEHLETQSQLRRDIRVRLLLLSIDPGPPGLISLFCRRCENGFKSSRTTFNFPKRSFISLRPENLVFGPPFCSVVIGCH
jgi:hypothetical protein